MHTDTGVERINTVVIGGGQAGLSVGHHLSRQRVPYVILDGNARIGDQWRRRWDSLRLFTPAHLSALDDLPFPAPPDSFPSKDAMADYLEAYARHWSLPVRSGARVTRLSRQKGRFVVVAGDSHLEADNVVVAMANHQCPKTPAFASELDPSIVQVHSVDYRNPAQLQPGGVLVAGAGNSGSEIAIELIRAGHETWMAGRDTGQVPFRIAGRVGRHLVRPVLRGLFHRVLTVDTPIGRRARPSMLHKGGPLIRVRRSDLTGIGVHLSPRVTGARNGQPLLEDGRVLDVKNIVWCTGFHPGFSWIDLPIFDSYGEPRHESGVVPGEPGVYFVGLHFLHAFSSEMIHGVGRDAARIAKLVAARTSREGSASDARSAA